MPLRPSPKKGRGDAEDFISSRGGAVGNDDEDDPDGPEDDWEDADRWA